jgi:hypothetical protein
VWWLARWGAVGLVAGIPVLTGLAWLTARGYIAGLEAALLGGLSGAGSVFTGQAAGRRLRR